MAEPKQALIAFCNNNTEIFATFGTRITADKIPDGQAYPHARVIVVSDPRTYLLSKGRSGRKIRLQLDVYAETVAGADTSVAVLETVLEGYKGMLGPLDAGYVFVKNIPGDWNETARNEHRILELEIGTND